MSVKTLNFHEFEINKNKFHGSKQPIVLDSVDINNKVTSSKFICEDKGFKHFIGYGDDDVIRPWCYILTQMSGFMEYFHNSSKNMSS